MAEAGMIRVSVCIGDPEGPTLVELELPAGRTLREAFDKSGLIVSLPGQSLEHCRTGVFGKLKPLDAVLHDGDRVEITLPLRTDPKAVRAERAAKHRKADAKAGRRWR
ncbi:MAG: RnfH family protein [Candidatus Protistobacter heckmanni]|nr:RnfH family protein [Candidatus Protistobacter heckmanni]